MIIRTLVAAGAIVLATATFATAHEGGRGRHEHDGRQQRRAAMAEKLNLTAEQKSAIKSIREKQRAIGQQLRGEIREKARRYVQLRDAKDSRADAIRQDLRALREEMQIRRVAARAEIGSVFTPQQRQKIEEMKASHRAKRAERQDAR